VMAKIHVGCCCVLTCSLWLSPFCLLFYGFFFLLSVILFFLRNFSLCFHIVCC
jgi:hypothetical protein